jgi:hypothetical protein
MKKSTPHTSPATPIDSALRRQLDVLFHSLGLSESGEGNIHRNHFVTSPDTIDFAPCRELVAMGMMHERPGNALSGGENTLVFCVTPQGLEFAKKNTPKKKPLTRGQQRYRSWLRADGGMTFGEWLKIPACSR